MREERNMNIQAGYPASRWFVLAAASVAIASAYMNIVAFAPILNDIARDLGINPGKAVDLISMTYIVSAVAFMVGGLVTDRWGVTLTLMLGILSVSLPSAAMPWIGHSYYPVMVLRLIQGIAPGFLLVAIGPIAGLWFPQKEHGIACGLMAGSLSVGAALGMIFSPSVLAAVGNWQETMAILSCLAWLGFVLVLVMRWKVPQPAVRAENAGPVPAQTKNGQSFKKVLMLPVTFLAVGAGVCNAWGFHALYALVPVYLSAAAPSGLGLSAIAAGKLSSYLTVVGIVAIIGGGIFLDRVAKGNVRIVLAGGFFLSALGSYLFLQPFVYSRMHFLILCLIVAGWGLPFTTAAFNTFIIRTYPMEIVGRVLGIVGGISTLGAAAGVCVGGVVATHTGSYSSAIMLIAVVCILGCLFSLFLKPAGELVSGARPMESVQK